MPAVEFRMNAGSGIQLEITSNEIQLEIIGS